MSYLTNINTALVSAIESMSISNNYNFNYNVNQEDFNKVSFPLINVYLMPSDDEMEASLYCMTEMRAFSSWQLHCYNKALQEGCNNKFLNNYVLYAMLHDVKRMIGHNYTLGGICEGILYRRSFNSPSGLRSDIFIPEKLVVEIDIPYSEIR
jgi:hypothetical protein